MPDTNFRGEVVQMIPFRAVPEDLFFTKDLNKDDVELRTYPQGGFNILKQQHMLKNARNMSKNPLTARWMFKTRWKNGCAQDKTISKQSVFEINKMKPTNPNADTYVENQRLNTYLSQFPASPFLEHPDWTHWGDTLVGHPCLTLWRYALVRHSCMTLWFDTLVGHFLLDTSYLDLALLTWPSSGTLWLDNLVRHSCLTDTLLRHSYLRLL